MTDVVASLECILASLEQCSSPKKVRFGQLIDPRNACTEEEEEEEDEEEEDVNVHGDSNQQIYDDKNTQQNDILPQSTVTSPSTPVHFNENTQRQKRSKKNLFQRGISFLARSIDIWSTKISTVEIQTTAVNETIFQGMSPTLRIFSFSELRYATRNFSPDRLLGEGRFGQAYRGRLDEKVTSNNITGFDVAVKKLDYRRIKRFKDWQSVVGFLGGLSHSNLVKLLGYCWEDEKLFLVYEFMPKGSLENHLFRQGPLVLPWSIRLKILIGAARGLAFLHASETPVICKDFQTSNIFLDGSFNSKISYFGDTESSFGYIAPEYFATGHFDVRSDVYSFGVVLLEMLTGLRAYDTNCPTWPLNLVDWEPFLEIRRKLRTVMDSRLEGEYPPKATQQLALLAQQCLGYYPKKRPSMEQVAETLEHINLLKHEQLINIRLDW
ncbi:hypothetical protein Vadar_021297 [Vaccinium darrowii]|uniref:Uncharacterized protein n=1 Tax=Vaccinium darrowii TaxID=229202 RepID=A0ACB7ZLK6_9ERIC|nr:hypothetical protein Vadar_021297 [Vaccinium darrowii]